MPNLCLLEEVVELFNEPGSDTQIIIDVQIIDKNIHVLDTYDEERAMNKVFDFIMSED